MKIHRNENRIGTYAQFSEIDLLKMPKLGRGKAATLDTFFEQKYNIGNVSNECRAYLPADMKQIKEGEFFRGEK